MITSPPFIPDPDRAEARTVNARLANMPHPDVTTPAGLAAVRATGFHAPVSPLHRPPLEQLIDGPAGPIRLRIIQPAATARAVILSIHGGGWCIGSPEEDDAYNYQLATTLDVATVSPDYRLAPEHPHPAGYQDCAAVLAWIVDNARATFGTDRLIIGGSSAGAHLASLVLLHARDQLQVLDRVVAANLIFGCYDIRATPSALHATPQTLLLTSDWISQFRTNAFGADASLRDPRTSPLYAKLDGLPAALFTVGALDPLLDDSLFMAARWRAAGGHSDVDVWPACAHGFIGTMPITGSRAVARISDWLAAHLRANDER